MNQRLAQTPELYLLALRVCGRGRDRRDECCPNLCVSCQPSPRCVPSRSCSSAASTPSPPSNASSSTPSTASKSLWSAMPPSRPLLMVANQVRAHEPGLCHGVAHDRASAFAIFDAAERDAGCQDAETHSDADADADDWGRGERAASAGY